MKSFKPFTLPWWLAVQNKITHMAVRESWDVIAGKKKIHQSKYEEYYLKSIWIQARIIRNYSRNS